MAGIIPEPDKPTPKTDRVIANSEYLRDSEEVKTWMRLGHFADNTSMNYVRGLHMFCKLHDMTPDQLLTEAEEQHSLIPRKQNLKLRIADFKTSIGHMAPNTQAILMTGVRSFYKNHDIVPPIDPNRTTNNTNTLIENDWKGFGKEVVRDCLKHLNMRDRAILLVMISSGQARAETMDLRINDMVDIDDNNITTLDIHREKSHTNYRTFFSPEATAAVQAYLNERKQRVKEMGIIDDNPYLFVTKWGKEIRKLEVDAFNNIFLRLSKKMGEEFRTDPYTFNMLRSHNFRKFFKSQMQNAGVPEWQCEYQMGHTLKPLEKAYFLADKDKMKEVYVKHMAAVMVETEIQQVSFEDSAEFQKLKAENEQMKTKFVEQEAKFKAEMDAFKAQMMAEVRQTVDALTFTEDQHRQDKIMKGAD